MPNLILGRRVGETICIGDDVLVTVVSVGRHQVKIGIQAPHSVEVDREEIRQRKRNNVPFVRRSA